MERGRTTRSDEHLVPASSLGAVSACLVLGLLVAQAIRHLPPTLSVPETPLGDERFVGTWRMLAEGGSGTRTAVLRIQSDGSYRLSPQAAAGRPEAGHFQAEGGIWSLRAWTGRLDGGSYRFGSETSVVLNGNRQWWTLLRLGGPGESFSLPEE